MTAKYGERTAWDWAVALLPMLGWLRTYNVRGWLLVRPEPWPSPKTLRPHSYGSACNQ